jgi:hypothetical protein
LCLASCWLSTSHTRAFWRLDFVNSWVDLGHVPKMAMTWSIVHLIVLFLKIAKRKLHWCAFAHCLLHKRVRDKPKWLSRTEKLDYNISSWWNIYSLALPSPVLYAYGIIMPHGRESLFTLSRFVCTCIVHTYSLLSTNFLFRPYNHPSPFFSLNILYNTVLWFATSFPNLTPYDPALIASIGSRSAFSSFSTRASIFL